MFSKINMSKIGAMDVGWEGEGGMVGNIGLLESHLPHLTRYHRPQTVILSILVIKLS